MGLKVLRTTFVLMFLVRCLGVEASLDVSEDDFVTLYENYREALEENELKSSRRVFINNIEYQMHVNKLKDVNGLKLHNLILRTENQPNVNKTIYITNPVESKLPHPFLSFDEFKQTLTDRIQKQKDEVKKENLKAELEKARKNRTKTTIKPKSLKTIYFIKATHTPNSIKHKIENASSKITNVFNKSNAKPTQEIPKAQETKIKTKPKFIKTNTAQEQIKLTLPSGKPKTNSIKPPAATTKNNLILQVISNAKTLPSNEPKSKSTKPTPITNKQKSILHTITNAKTLPSSEPKTISAKPTVIITKQAIILRAILNATTPKPLLIQSTSTNNHTTTTRSDNGTSETTSDISPETNKEIATAKDSKEINTETLVPSGNETTDADAEVVTDVNVTDTVAAELETTTIEETETTETPTEEPTTTTISTRATLGRPAVYMGR